MPNEERYTQNMQQKSLQQERQGQNQSKTARRRILLVLSILSTFATTTSAIGPKTAFVSTTERTKSTIFYHSVKSRHDHSSVKLYQSDSDNEKESHPMSNNFLSHAMLRVPNVNATVNYWINRGATRQSHGFVNFQDSSPFKSPSSSSSSSVNGDDTNEPKMKRFSFEIVPVQPKEVDAWSIGNVIQYFGLSMLLNFDLRSAAAGTKPSSPMNDYDPNNILIKSVASGPGDPLSRICLHISPEVGLGETADFYTNVLGMEQVAVDEKMVCLRYTGNVVEDEVDGKKKSVGGVSTTLVFVPLTSLEGDEDVKLDHGNCLDHFAIDTKSLEVAQQVLKEKGKEDCIFMEPTAMFGTTLMGLEDPSGYKIYLVERKNLN